jgi:Domain of unknown function (DUF4136)
MKALKILPVIMLFLLASCSSVRVTSDYETTTDFNKFKTYAFYKKGIDKVDISDLDKRRILRALERELQAKGFTKSEEPDLLVSIFTKSKEKLNVYNDFYGYWGWYPWYYGPYGTYVNQYTEGTLFIDLIDAKKKELAWQGVGKGALITSGDRVKKEVKIKEFVTKIMEAYPPIIQ